MSKMATFNVYTYKKFPAFTLAEVLITLVVIGVIAALTIPNLITNIQNQHYKTAYKKAFSEATLTWNTMKSQNVITYSENLYDTGEVILNFNQFKQNFSIIRECSGDIPDMDRCWATDGEYYGFPEDTAMSDRAFIDGSGRTWFFTTKYGGLMINIDINGLASPNKYGRDRFLLRAVRAEAQSPEEAADKVNGCPGTPSSCAGEGLYEKIFPDIDKSGAGAGCHYPPCYGKSWLMN